MTKRKVYKAKTYNNSREIFFLMDAKNAAERNELLGEENYTLVDDVISFDRKSRLVITTDGTQCRWFPDYSLKAI